MLQQAFALTELARREPSTRARATELAETLLKIANSENELLFCREEAVPDLSQALHKIVDGPRQRIVCWMLAGVVATGVATAHQLTTSELVGADVEADLQRSLTDFGLS